MDSWVNVRHIDGSLSYRFTEFLFSWIQDLVSNIFGFGLLDTGRLKRWWVRSNVWTSSTGVSDKSVVWCPTNNNGHTQNAYEHEVAVSLSQVCLNFEKQCEYLQMLIYTPFAYAFNYVNMWRNLMLIVSVLLTGSCSLYEISG